jgi:hypothetical protein
MSEESPKAEQTESPIEPLYTHPASPFVKTEAPVPLQFDIEAQPSAQSTWVTYRTQIELGLAVLAYLMVLVGSVTVLEANPGDAERRYIVAALPVIPAALTVWIVVRALGRLDEIQKRIQVQAFGFSIVSTALLTFAYGFLEGVGLPHLNWTFVLPMIAALWGIGTAVFTYLHR